MTEATPRKKLTLRRSTPAEVAARSPLYARMVRARVFLFGAIADMPTAGKPPEDPSDPREAAYEQACKLITEIADQITRKSYDAAKERAISMGLHYIKPGTEEDTWAAVDAAFA